MKAAVTKLTLSVAKSSVQLKYGDVFIQKLKEQNSKLTSEAIDKDKVIESFQTNNPSPLIDQLNATIRTQTEKMNE